MTSDAKIGLLLGLVFIFIIAFIINGLPNFKSETDNNELTTTMVSLQNKQLGIGSGITDSEVLERPRILERSIVTQEPVVQAPMVQEPQMIDQTINIAPTTDGSETVRYSTALPGSGNSNNDFLIETPAPTKTIEIVAPAQQQVVVTREVPSVEENSLRQVSSDVVVQVKKPIAIAVPQVREYVVQEGDSLGSISKKLYGQELGNKKVNIDKIFAANKKSLKSPDAIYVGQKLIIPALEGTQAVEVSKKKTFGSGMLEKVKQIGRRGFSSTKQEPKKVVVPAKVAGRKYVVKDGDNLWKIAHSELGDGSRFGEIAKMNKDVLKSQDSIVVGMTLVLPKK